MNLDTLRAKLRTHTGEDEFDIDDPATDLLLNQSYWELGDKFPFREKERVVESDFVVDQRLYTAPSPFEALQHIAVVHDTGGASDSGQHQKLRRMDLKWYEDQYAAGTGRVGVPEFYARRDNGFYVWPTPDLDYGMVIYYWTTLADLVADIDTPDMPQVWNEIIMYGGVWRRFLELGDVVRSREIRNHQVGLINSTQPVEAKEETDSRFAGVSVPEEMFDRDTMGGRRRR
jgi:hypothetical protein